MKRNPPLLFIFLTIFIDLLGIGIVLPLLPEYVKIVERSSWPWLADNRALVVGALTASYALMQFLFAPILGALSDRFGRRPILLLSLFGVGLSYLVFAVAENLTFLGVETVIGLLFLARITAGITGASISTAQAYIADVTPPSERARGLGMIGAAFGLGFMLGPAIGGLLSNISLQAPALFAAALSFANVMFGFFRLPESLPPEKRMRSVSRNLNPVTRLTAVARDPRVQPFIFGSVLFNLAFAGLQSNFPVYSDVRFGFSPQQNALIFAFIGLIAVLVQGFLIRKLVARFGEARLALAGLTLMALGFAATGLAPASWMLFPAIGIVALGSGMLTPSLTSLISQSVSATEQGAILGGVQSFNSLTMVLGPLLAGTLFDLIAPNAPYLFGAVLLTGALTVLLSTLRRRFVPIPQPDTAVVTIDTPVRVE
ncbi:MAG: tetracycline resistance MFS efflux pump [Chloroflexus sp.]|uniref:MFS transporter n=1 Tax=Chloroflexus sp. TaxID=1904827 RepID=UPI0021DE4174|nr:MFS transporter [Chloroflexus sp.]GIV88517.1 MAG: tetracycline resistance MFS efflux pump [Chloroflexus sp.]